MGSGRYPVASGREELAIEIQVLRGAGGTEEPKVEKEDDEEGDEGAGRVEE